jgi:hypothetical protein
MNILNSVVYFVTTIGRLFLQLIASYFDPYLQDQHYQISRIFSKAV